MYRKRTNRVIKPLLLLFTFLFLIIVNITMLVFAADVKEKNLYYMGEDELVKKDKNYDKELVIGSNDLHAGWRLGRFCISGFSGRPKTVDGKLVFLKNVGDEISLSFLLEQDIDNLNGQDNLSISDDNKAYDEYFHIYKKDATDFGRGTLLIKKTDYQNSKTYDWYSNYLDGIKKGANTKIILFEEGDYEIALDYEIEEKFFGLIPNPTNYQILIAFSIRNSNCMVYPFDAVTGSELVNTAFTENGFYLDMARSRYLDINIVKQLLIEKDNSFETDTRFNKTATDGEEFTDDGIYVITVHNRYTNSGDTVKKIYVGKDPILKAYVTTGDSVAHIKELVSKGAKIEDDGTISIPLMEYEQNQSAASENLMPEEIDDSKGKTVPLETVVIILAIIISVFVFVVWKIIKGSEKRFNQNQTAAESTLSTDWMGKEDESLSKGEEEE